MPKTINEALKILAYNDYFWSDPLTTQKAQIKPHPKDYETVRSLAESQYAMDRETGQISTSDTQKIPDQVPSTRHGHQEHY